MLRLIVPVILLLALTAGLTACGSDDPAPTATTAPAPATSAPEPTPVPPTATAPPAATATPEPTAAAAEPTPVPAATEEPEPTPAPTAAPTATPATPTPQPTAAPPALTEQEQLAAYAAEHTNGPGAIFVGDPLQLVGPPPHEGLMFEMPTELYNQISTLALFGSEELGAPSHLFIYTSDYYQGLIQKAKLTDPTELVSSGENIEIQHVCIDRNLPPCVLIQTYLAPNIAKRTNGQVKLSVISYAELQIDGSDALNQVGDGTFEMINIYTGYVAGALPALEIQSLWGSAPDWETSYTTLTLLAEDIDRIMLEATGGSPVLNRNWFAGTDQWFYSKEPLQAVEDYKDVKIRTHAASMSDFIAGMGGEPFQTSLAELYVALEQGFVDAAAYGALLAVASNLYEVTDYMAGPIIGFGYTNNVINKDIWAGIPEDLQRIIIEEGAKAELEALRLAPFQNVAAVAINQQLGVRVVPFSDEIYLHIQRVVLPEHVIPGWVRRLGFPERNADIVAISNEKLSPYTGLWINEDGSVKQVPITEGPRATQ